MTTSNTTNDTDSSDFCGQQKHDAFLKNPDLVPCSACYTIVKPKRIGRAHYHCPKCDSDISMTVFYYEEGERNDA